MAAPLGGFEGVRGVQYVRGERVPAGTPVDCDGEIQGVGGGIDCAHLRRLCRGLPRLTRLAGALRLALARSCRRAGGGR
eukprot:742147-Prorocentrum_minimum.AAC.1